MDSVLSVVLQFGPIVLALGFFWGEHWSERLLSLGVGLLGSALLTVLGSRFFEVTVWSRSGAVDNQLLMPVAGFVAGVGVLLVIVALPFFMKRKRSR